MAKGEEMTDLVTLIAKLGDCPRTEAYIETPTEPSRFGKAHLRDLADAALMELAEKAIEARDCSICIFCGETMAKDMSVMLKHAEGCEKRPENRLLKRAEAAEARVAELEQQNTRWDAMYHGMMAERDGYWEDVERLRCCGNCVHYEQDPDFVGTCEASGHVAEEHQAFADGRYIVCHHACIFTPSRWAARDCEEEKDA